MNYERDSHMPYLICTGQRPLCTAPSWKLRVRHVDRSILDREGKTPEDLPIRHDIERHGAIRLGTENELHEVKRLFGILGMCQVGYYDLHVVGLPLHGTAFRPIDELSDEKSVPSVCHCAAERTCLSRHKI